MYMHIMLLHVCNYINLNLLLALATTGQTCRAENQVYTLNAPDCNPTCNNPNPPCLGTFREGCTCPNGTILDEIQNRCVPLSECSKNI